MNRSFQLSSADLLEKLHVGYPIFVNIVVPAPAEPKRLTGGN